MSEMKRAYESEADEFDMLILPAFEFLRSRGERDLVLRLVAISVDFGRPTPTKERQGND